MINTVRGFRDILYPESLIFYHIEKTSRKIFEHFNYKEIIIPTVEYQELFVKSTGETTDIVEKEMYVFSDSSNRTLALRPEGTPGIIRVYINHKLNLKGETTKYYYIANMFRAERPQAGRFREFRQIGAEFIGNSSPFADAETIIMLDNIFKFLNLSDNYSVEINSIGCSECRKKYREKLVSYLSRIDLCNQCKLRLNRNPLRILDCKTDREKLKDVPEIELCESCADHYTKLKKILSENNINFTENKLLVRGLDYYTRTVFEFKTRMLGSQDALAAGGRYDNLVKSMGGPDAPSVGWAMGVDRIAILIEKLEVFKPEKKLTFVICADKKYDEKAFEILKILRENGINADFHDFESSVKSQFRHANSNNASYAIIIGEEEVKQSKFTLKNLKNSTQNMFTLEEIIKKLKTEF